MRPARVCHVITRLELGGAQDNTLHTVRGLGTEFAVSLLSGRGGMLDDEARRIPGIDLTFVPGLVRPLSPVHDLRSAWALYREMRRLRPDIVHTHSSKAGILGRAAARAAGVPVIVHTIHGFGFNDRQPQPLRAALVGLERLVAPWTTHVIAVSSAHIEAGAALGIVDRGRSSVIRSGVHLEAFRSAARRYPSPRMAPLRRELRLPEGAPLVGMVACLKPQKAPLDFVEVAARVLAGFPAAHFVIAGDGELRSAVERRAAELGIAGRLHLLGWRRDIPEIMAALDVAVLTSLWEGLPRVVPEAIAAGRTVVATAVDGTAEILRDGDNAFVAPPGDRAALAGGVLRLLGDPDAGIAMAARAIPLLEEFDIDAMVRAQADLYRRLLAERSGVGMRGPANAARSRAA
jgi:glycosyltransferase involved in cell wall biosynthesis